MAYPGVDWKNKPNHTSPINAANLEIMDNQIYVNSIAANGVYYKVTFPNTGFVNRSGAIASNADYGHSNYIPVELLNPKMSVYWNHNIANVAFYNSGKTFLSYYENNSDTFAEDTITIPANAVYAVVSARLSDNNKVYAAVNVADAQKGFFDELYDSVGNAIRTQVGDLYGHISILKEIVPLTNAGYVTTSGSINVTPNWFHSDLIPVEFFYKHIKMNFNKNLASIAYYDSNRAFLSYYTHSANGVYEEDIEIPSGARYICISNDITQTEYKVYQTYDFLTDIDERLDQYDGYGVGIEDNKKSLLSAISAGFAEVGEYEDFGYTDTNIENPTNTYNGNNNGYMNGALLPAGSKISKIKLNSGCTTTQFSIWFFDENFVLMHEILSITPTITNHIFDLPEEYSMPKNGYVMIAFHNGSWKAIRRGTSNLKEYRSGTTLYDSPLQASFDVGYQGIKTVKFVEGFSSGPQLTDFDMPKTIRDDSKQYTLIGRWFDKDGYKCANADGSSLMFKVTGTTSVTVEFGTLSTPNYEPYFAYSIDGGAFIRQHISSTSITLPDNEEHFVWIVVDGMGENDPTQGKWSGTVGLKLISISGGTLSGVITKNRQILFVGDSMVEGINVLGTGANADVNSATGGFAFKTARLLDAIPLMCGYGGTSTLGANSFAKAIEAIQYNYDGVPVNLLTPDVVLIEHGFNDLGRINQGLNTTDDFVASYTALINKIRVMYTGIPIICMIPFKQSLAQYIRQVAADFDNAYVIETSGYTVETSDNTHPSAIGATHAAQSLSKDIELLLGKSFFFNI